MKRNSAYAGGHVGDDVAVGQRKARAAGRMRCELGFVRQGQGGRRRAEKGKGWERVWQSNGTHLFVTAKHHKAAATWLASFRCAQRPERDWSPAVLGKPALQLALCGVVWKAAKVEDFGTLAEEGANVASRIERTREYIWVALWIALRRTRLRGERADAAGERQCLLHRATRRRRCESLQMEG